MERVYRRSARREPTALGREDERKQPFNERTCSLVNWNKETGMEPVSRLYCNSSSVKLARFPISVGSKEAK